MISFLQCLRKKTSSLDLTVKLNKLIYPFVCWFSGFQEIFLSDLCNFLTHLISLCVSPNVPYRQSDMIIISSLLLVGDSVFDGIDKTALALPVKILEKAKTAKTSLASQEANKLTYFN